MQSIGADGRQHLPGVDSRRILGKYYTPEGLAEIIACWALAGGSGTVLDPSYGGCAFLNAAARVLSVEGVENPAHLLYGVDVDPTCAHTARRNEWLLETNCITADFLGTSPADLPGAPFRAIVGNPPYVRHHWLKGRQRERARAVAVNSAVPLRATASMWAYFLLHALNFLQRDGRLAMLVPEAILQAEYAAPLRQVLSERFGRSLLVHIRDRQFDRTDETVVVVAASEFGERGRVSIAAIDGLEDLAPLLADSRSVRPSSEAAVVNGRRTTTSVLQLLEEIAEASTVRRLTELAEVRIGFVTGANSYFIRNRLDLEELDLPVGVVHPVVRRTNWLTGLQFTQDDHERVAAGGAAGFLVCPTPSDQQHPGVRHWMTDGVARGVDRRTKCLTRRSWFRVPLPPAPDAFATCSRLGAPRLVLNRSHYRCSNALHAVRWIPDAEVVPEAVAVGFMTTAVAVWAELLGRRYGGGVLKIEPGTLVRIPIPVVPGAEDGFGVVDRLLRQGKEKAAREYADERILGDALGLTTDQRRMLVEAHSLLMNQRRPVRRGGGDAEIHG
ncbi:MAG: N-6 DNA methylase [Rhodococcus sp.]|nr:N-6 DNA methylase [Rhodococcus sp. (in: high G+C Gram-positive bacteria)]